MTNIEYKRNSGVELARFLSIVFILGIHMINLIIGMPYTKELEENPIQSITLISFESLFIVCVDIFIIISGWFEIHASSRGLFLLMFQCLFFTIVNIGISCLVLGNDISLGVFAKSLITGCFPGWFISAYIVLYILSPIINSFVKNEPHRARNILFVGFSILFLYGWFLNGCSGNQSTFLSGYSALFMIFLYAGVRFLKMYHAEYLNHFSIKFWFFLWVGLLILNIIIWVATASVGIGEINSKIFLYTSPIVILESFSMFMFFLRLNIRSKLLNWLGASSLSIMLLHWSCNGHFFKGMTSFAFFNYHGIRCLFSLFTAICIITIFAVVIDQFRKYIWSIIEKSRWINCIKF